MNPTGDNHEFESPTPPLTISPEESGLDKPSNGAQELFLKEERLSSSTSSPTRPVYSNSDGGNASPVTLDSQSPPPCQDMDLANCGFLEADFTHGDLSSGKRRLKEWLVEQINSGRYDGLKWLTGGKTLFSVPWKHAREKTYCMDKDAALYKEWASYSGKHRKSEANPINWKLNFRCALYSVRGIKERKDVYIRGHRVYELTDSASDTPCKEYPQVPTQIPGFSKSLTETPDELISCPFDESLTVDITPRYIGSQPSASQSSQYSVNSKFTNLNTGSQGDVLPGSPSLQLGRNYFVMPGPGANSHISPITPISYIDTPTSKFNTLLPSPGTPGLTPTLPRYDSSHEMPPSLLVPPLPPAGLFKKKSPYPSSLCTLSTPPTHPKMTNGSSPDVACTPINKHIPLASPAITSPAPIAIGFVLPTTPTIPFSLQASALKSSPFPISADGSAQQFIKSELLPHSLTNSALRDNLSLSRYLNLDAFQRHSAVTDLNDEATVDHFKQLYNNSSANTPQLNEPQKRSLSSSCENIVHSEPKKKRKSLSETPHRPLSDATNIISTVEMHTCEDPVRIITSGYPQVSGASILDKQKYARDRLDHLRRRLLLKPRGNSDMCGVLPVAPDHPEADVAVLLMDGSGYQSMCGHCIIALGRYALDYNLVRPHAPETKVNIQCPCGVVKTFVEYSNGVSGRVRFHSVPAFVYARNQEVELPDYGSVRYDIAYGGAYYAIVSASEFDLDFDQSPSDSLASAGECLLQAVRSSFRSESGDPSDPAQLLGVILVEDSEDNADKVSANFVVCRNRQVARSPCGSSVTARIALQFYKHQVQLGDLRTFRGPSGGFFTGRALREETRGDQSGVVVEVSGHGYYTGSCKFTAETEDALCNGRMLN